MEQPKRDAPFFPSPLSQSGFHRCTINDALTALTTQPKSACNTGTVDPFRESVARIARTRAAEAVRIAVLQTTVPESGLAPVGGSLFGDVLRAACSPTRFEFSSKFLESAALHSAIGNGRLGCVHGCGGIWAFLGRGRRGCRILALNGDSGMRLQASPMMPLPLDQADAANQPPVMTRVSRRIRPR